MLNDQYSSQSYKTYKYFFQLQKKSCKTEKNYRIDYSSVSQPFLTRGTLNIRKNFEAH